MRNTIKQTQISTYAPWIMWGLGALTFFIQYIIRVAPGSMVPSLMDAFDASSLDVSAFAAYFLYAYVLMQIPAGILVDRLGPRICLSVSTALFAICSFLFAYTDNLWIAKLARLFLGFGAAFALVGTLKLAISWFKPQLFSILVGATQALGMIGGAAGASIIGRLANIVSWQTTLQYFSGVLGVLAIFIAIFVRNSQAPHASQPKNLPAIDGLKTVFKSSQTWLIAIFSGLLFMPTAVFAELWGGLYLVTTQGITPNQANGGISIIFLGWAVGGPIAGMLANRFGRRPIMISASFVTLLLMSLILYSSAMPLTLLYTLLFIYGFCNCGLVATYTSIAELNPKYAGIALGFGNGMSVIVGAFCQQWVGALVDWLHLREITINSVNYTAHELKLAMSIVVIGMIMAFILSLFTKETLKNLR